MGALNRLVTVLFAIPICTLLPLGAAAPAQAVATSTVTVINPPGLGTLNSYNTLTATVTAQDGATAPVGSIQFRTASGTVIAAAATQRGATIAEATASIVWYAPELRTYEFSAIFYPEDGALLTGSQTRTDTAVEVTPNGQNVQIQVPQFYRGITSELIATTYPATLQGSVSFTINGSPMSASIAVVNGRATFPFVTQSLGWQDIGVNFSLLNNQNVFGVAHMWVEVLPSKGAAETTFSPPITELAYGQSQLFVLNAPSGPVNSLSAAGSCTAARLVVTTTGGAGYCTLTAISSYGQGYDGAATSISFQLVSGTQTARTNTPDGAQNGRENIDLIVGDNRTNIGIGIKWSVIQGTDNCAIASGAHFARARVSGPCTIRGSAKGVAGRWSPYEITRAFDTAGRAVSGR